MSDFQHLAQWAEPDGDNDELENIRLDIRTLLAEYRKTQKKLEAAQSVLWMAEQYADGHAIAETGAEQRELEAVMEVLKS